MLLIKERIKILGFFLVVVVIVIILLLVISLLLNSYRNINNFMELKSFKEHTMLSPAVVVINEAEAAEESLSWLSRLYDWWIQRRMDQAWDEGSWIVQPTDPNADRLSREDYLKKSILGWGQPYIYPEPSWDPSHPDWPNGDADSSGMGS